MFCTKCGVELEPQVNYCCQCGQPTSTAVAVNRASRRLTLSKRDKKIAGVCSGFAHYFGVDATLMRIIWLGLVFAGIGLILYPLAWMIMPSDDSAMTTTSAVSHV